MKTASRIAQDYNYGQDQSGSASTQAEFDQSQQSTTDLLEGVGGMIMGGLGAFTLASGVAQLSEARTRYSDLTGEMNAPGQFTPTFSTSGTDKYGDQVTTTYGAARDY